MEEERRPPLNLLGAGKARGGEGIDPFHEGENVLHVDRRPQPGRLPAALAPAISICILLTANAAAKVPKKVQIVDPRGDANYLNDGTLPLPLNDIVTPVDASSAGDLLKMWFTHDSRTITAHIQTEAVPGDGAALAFFVAANAEGATSPFGCVVFALRIPARTYLGQPEAYFLDLCGTGERLKGKFHIEELPDGTAILRIQLRRSISEYFAVGQTLSDPHVLSRHTWGSQPHSIRHNAPTIDHTKRGTSYKIDS